MINLLPPQEKQLFLLSRKKKLVIILWIFILFSLVVFLIVLCFLKFYLQSELNSQKAIFQQEEKMFKQSEIQKLQEQINSANLVLVKLDAFYENKVFLVEIIEKLSGNLPDGIYN